MLRLDGENFDNILNKMDYIEIYICKHLNHVFKKSLKDDIASIIEVAANMTLHFLTTVCLMYMFVCSSCDFD